jgi:hypothetical protein
VNAQTIAILEAYINDPEPESNDPLPLATSHCGDTCGDPRCHYQCDPVTCLSAAWEAYIDATTPWDDDYCESCNGTCTL